MPTTVTGMIAGRHRVTVGFPSLPGAALRIESARWCQPDCTGGTVHPIDVSVTAPNPDAVHALVAGTPTGSYSTSVSVPSGGSGLVLRRVRRPRQRPHPPP